MDLYIFNVNNIMLDKDFYRNLNFCYHYFLMTMNLVTIVFIFDEIMLYSSILRQKINEVHSLLFLCASICLYHFCSLFHH